MIERSDYGLISIAAILALAVLDWLAFRRRSSKTVASGNRYVLILGCAGILTLVAVSGIFKALSGHPAGLYVALILFVMALTERIRRVYRRQKARE